jgi:hypothetical protein
MFDERVVELIVKTMEESELDCSYWSTKVLRQLAEELVDALLKAGYEIERKNV